METDSQWHGALARTGRAVVWLGAAGTVAFFWWRGWPWAAGFALGTAGSAWYFRSLQRAVAGLGEAAPGRTRTAVLVGLRYLLFGAAAYVIVNFTPLSLTACFAGLFVPVAAVILEMLRELFYGTTS